ncbi:MAG: TolC family protein, partial [Planctomycetes bacterium]|nr:TolC family protein [Planctomycetota bacterium]
MIKCRLISTFILIASLYFSGCASQPNKADSTLPPSYKPAINASAAKLARRPEKAETQSKLPELNESATLQDYLAYAALSNPGLEAAFNRFKAALEEVPQAKALPDPRFNYQYFIQEVETRVGPQRQSYGIAQMFPWFGKLDLKGDIAAQAANAARQRYEAAKLKLFFEVKDAYYEYYYLEKSIAVTKENVNLIKHLESVARSRYEAGAAAHPDVIRAQVELGKVDDRHRTLIDLRRPIVARLNAALNRPVDADIPGPRKIELQQTAVSDEQLLARLIDSNPELKAIEHEIARNKNAIELAKKNY